jgi:hypothetical protein
MADISVTSTLVLGAAVKTTFYAPAGGTLTAGEPVYIDGNGLLQKAKNDTAAHVAAVGILLLGGAINQRLPYCGTAGDIITIGGTTVIGETWMVSSNAGGICPVADLMSTFWVFQLGYSINVTQIILTMVNYNIQHA